MALSELATGRAGRTVSFLQAIAATFRTAHVSFLAASIAYSAFVSLLPLLVLLTMAASVFGGEAVVQTLLDVTATYLSPTGQRLVVGTVERAAAGTGLSVLSVLVLSWASMRLFRALDLAFSLLYGTADRTGLARQLIDGTIVLAAMLLAFAGTVVAAVLVALVPALPWLHLLQPIALVVFLTVALLPLYYVFPDRPLSVREVLPGAVVAAVGWTLLEFGFAVYVRLSSTAELYGVVGGIILLVTWLYFGALAVLLGATVNVVVSQGSPTGDRVST